MPWLLYIISNVVLASLLALTAWYIQRRLRWHAAAGILWVLVLVKLVTPPLVSVPLGESPGTMSCALGICRCGPHAQTLAIVRDTLPWVLLVIWSAGAGARICSAWHRWTQFRQLTMHAKPAPLEWQSLAARLASELSMGSAPEMLAVPGRIPPLIIPGRRRPRMLLPMALMGRLNAPQREALLLHELTHIQRGDHLVRMLEFAIGVAYWWLPLVGWLGRQLRTCEETCCDAVVVAHLPQARRDYARLLLDVVDFTNPVPQKAVPQVTAMSAANDLQQRLHAILDTGATRRKWPATILVVGLAGALLPCGLRYDFAERDSLVRPAPTATGLDRKSASGPTRLPSGNRAGEISVAHCCPS